MILVKTTLMKNIIYTFVAVFSFVTFNQAQNPLAIPASISGTQFDLTLQEDSVELFPGVFTHTMGVNGPILGPTLIMNHGDLVNVSFTNNLSDTTTIHWHGMHVPAHVDGGPHTPISPLSVWNPTFTVLDRASTMWYHPHLMHKTNEHVQKGIAGFVIVKDSIEASLNLPRTYGVDDIPLVFQTKTLDEEKQIVTDMDYSAYDTLLLTNATIDAYHDFPAQVVRLRMLNGSSERAFKVGLSNGDPIYVIGSDGGLLEAPVELDKLQIVPGERYEILVDLSGLEGDTIQLMNYGSSIASGVYGTASIGGMGGSSISGYSDNYLNGADFSLLQINVVEQNLNPITEIPNSLVELNSLVNSDVDENRTITMSSSVMGPNGMLNGPFVFNSSTFDMSEVNYEIPLNNTEVWTLNNNTQIAHPFHIHDVQFNILEINGVEPPDYMKGWKDVVLVPAMMSTVKFITKFEDFANPDIPYMYHCHILTHEEEGMMGQFIVVEEHTDVEELNNNLFTLSPNPLSDILHIEINSSSAGHIKIIDMSGKICMIESFRSNMKTINLSSLKSGVYFVEIDGQVERIVKY